MIDYVQALRKPWALWGGNFHFQNNCLRIPALDNGIWDLAFPEVNWNPRSVVVMHCQDFINIDQHGVRELRLMEQHFGDHSQQVVAVTWELDLQERYHGPIHLSYFPTHTYNIIMNMRAMLDQWQPRLLGPRPQRYQCLNGIPRPQRVRAVAALDALGVPGHVSLGRDRNLPEWPYYPTYSGCENEDNYLRLLPIYGSSDINVVTETVYEYRPGIISEKTLFALMSLQVPIFIGYPGIVAHVRALGFDTFDDVIDTSYDWLPDDVRVEEAIRRNAGVLTHGTDRQALAQRLQRNQDLVLAWPEKMIKDYQQRCAEIQGLLTKT